MANHFLAAHFPKRHFVGRHFPPAGVIVVPPVEPEPEALPSGGASGSPAFSRVRNKRLKRLIYEEEIRDALIREALESGAPIGPMLQSGGSVEIDILDGLPPLEIVPGGRPVADKSGISFASARSRIESAHRVSTEVAESLVTQLETRNLGIATRKAIRIIRDEEDLFIILIAAGEL